MTRIMIFGTFDMIHQGHEDFFRQARELADNPFLIVSVARDSAAARHRGAMPRTTELARLALIKGHSLVDTAILGDEVGYLDHITRENPDIIALGYDQKGEYVDSLDTDLKTVGLKTKIIRLQPFQPEIYKTSKLRTA